MGNAKREMVQHFHLQMYEICWRHLQIYIPSLIFVTHPDLYTQYINSLSIFYSLSYSSSIILLGICKQHNLELTNWRWLQFEWDYRNLCFYQKGTWILTVSILFKWLRIVQITPWPFSTMTTTAEAFFTN